MVSSSTLKPEAPIIPDATFTALNADSSNWAANSDLKNALTTWTRNSPPSDRWWKYIVAQPSGWNDSTMTPPTCVFVPSLGLRYGKANTELDEATISGISVDNFLKKKYVIEAGTDCVGFAQRTASYTGNTYDWVELPNGWAETTADNIWTVEMASSFPHLFGKQKSPPRGLALLPG